MRVSNERVGFHIWPWIEQPLQAPVDWQMMDSYYMQEQTCHCDSRPGSDMLLAQERASR